MSTKLCPKCSGENDISAKTCVYCREPLEETPQAQQAPVQAVPLQPEPQQPTQAQPVQAQPVQAQPPAPQQPAPQQQPAPPQPLPPYPPQGQNIYTQPPQQPQKKKSAKLIIGIVAGVVVLIALIVVIAINAASCATGNIADADYYEIGGDQIPSVKTALGERFEVTSFVSQNNNGTEKQDIRFSTDGASNDQMYAYAQYLSEQGWLFLQDHDWNQASLPESGGQGFSLAKNSTTSGYVVAVTIYYEPGSFILILDRGEGNVDPLGVENPTPAPTDDVSPSPNEQDLWAPAYFEAFNERHYSMGITLFASADSTNNDASMSVESDMEIYVDGDREAIIMDMGGTIARLVIQDGKEYTIIDDERIIYVSAATGNTFAPNTRNMTFVSVGEEEFMGRMLYCETWKSEKGKDVKWFFDTEAGWIEGFTNTADDGTYNEVYIATLQFQGDFDKSVFDIPSDYEVVQQ